MNHLIRFESFSDDIDIKDSDELQSILTSYDGDLVEQVDAHINHLIKELIVDMDDSEYGDDDMLNEFSKLYVSFIRILADTKAIDIEKYYKEEANICQAEPFALSINTINGKAFLKDSKSEPDWHTYQPKEFLVSLVKSKEESAFTYLKDAKKVCNKVKGIKKKSIQENIFSAIAYVFVTYNKLRPIIKDISSKEPKFKGIKTDKTTFGKKLLNTGTKILSGIAGAATGIVAAGKLVMGVDSFFSQGSDSMGCFRACLKMIGKPAPPHLGIKMAKEDGASHVKLPTFDKGLEKINQTLAAGKPIIVGVDHKKGSVNFDKTTDHFVVIVGSGKDYKGNYYQFFDPGTSHVEKGTSSENKFYMDSDGLLSGTSAYNKNKKQYTLSWVRPTV